MIFWSCLITFGLLISGQNWFATAENSNNELEGTIPKHTNLIIKLDKSNHNEHRQLPVVSAMISDRKLHTRSMGDLNLVKYSISKRSIDLDSAAGHEKKYILVKKKPKHKKIKMEIYKPEMKYKKIKMKIPVKVLKKKKIKGYLVKKHHHHEHY